MVPALRRMVWQRLTGDPDNITSIRYYYYLYCCYVLEQCVSIFVKDVNLASGAESAAALAGELARIM